HFGHETRSMVNSTDVMAADQSAGDGESYCPAVRLRNQKRATLLGGICKKRRSVGVENSEKKEAPTQGRSKEPRPRGATEQHLADAPSNPCGFVSGALAKHCFCSSRAFRLRLVVFLGSRT